MTKKLILAGLLFGLFTMGCNNGEKGALNQNKDTLKQNSEHFESAIFSPNIVDGPCSVEGDIRSFEIHCDKDVHSFLINGSAMGQQILQAQYSYEYNFRIAKNGRQLVGFERLAEQLAFLITFTDFSTASVVLRDPQSASTLPAPRLRSNRIDNLVQDLTLLRVIDNLTTVIADPRVEMELGEFFRFHYVTRERFNFNHRESETFFNQIREHIVILQPGRGLIPLPPESVILPMSLGIVTRVVFDFLRDKAVCFLGSSHEDLADLHRNTTEYMANSGIHWNDPNASVQAERLFTDALLNPRSTYPAATKPMIFYWHTQNELGFDEFKPYLYIPSSILRSTYF